MLLKFGVGFGIKRGLASWCLGVAFCLCFGFGILGLVIRFVWLVWIGGFGYFGFGFVDFGVFL